RDPTPKELRATGVVRLALDEASIKVREGGPIDLEDDYAAPIWAGVVPLRLISGEPISCERSIAGIEAPDYVRGYHPANARDSDPANARGYDPAKARGSNPANARGDDSPDVRDFAER
ncbi:MAG: hypothetical protein O7G84_08990, partial [Gammaproteobacteria bacterium]|nr:hypothetical protein [Gammaproteobacteria bacterium]